MNKSDVFISKKAGKPCVVSILTKYDSGKVVLSRIEGKSFYCDPEDARIYRDTQRPNTLDLAVGPCRVSLSDARITEKIIKEAPPLEVTMAEIEKKFGRKIRIVEKKEDNAK